MCGFFCFSFPGHLDDIIFLSIICLLQLPYICANHSFGLLCHPSVLCWYVINFQVCLGLGLTSVWSPDGLCTRAALYLHTDNDSSDAASVSRRSNLNDDRLRDEQLTAYRAKFKVRIAPPCSQRVLPPDIVSLPVACLARQGDTSQDTLLHVKHPYPSFFNEPVPLHLGNSTSFFVTLPLPLCLKPLSLAID